MLKDLIKPVSGMLALSLLLGAVDSMTNDKILFFSLHSNFFGRKVDNVTPNKDYVVDVFDFYHSDEISDYEWSAHKWNNCKNSKNNRFYLDINTFHTLILSETLDESYQITVKSISGEEDPVIVIMSLDQKILGCQNKNNSAVEVVNTDLEYPKWKFLQNKGTYYILLGGSDSKVDEYQVTVKKERQLKKKDSIKKEINIH